MLMDRRRRGLAALFAVLAALSIPVLGAGHTSAQESGALTGTFRITPGQCAPGASGSYFRMILPTGTLEGPWVDNGDSTCADRTYTPLAPGTDGGLVVGGYQPAPSPGF